MTLQLIYLVKAAHGASHPTLASGVHTLCNYARRLLACC
jgi:hypothetical protein